MKMQRSITPFAALAFVALALAGCTAAPSGDETTEICEPKFGEFETITPGRLTVAAPNSIPRFFGDLSAPEGLDADLIGQFAADSCLEPEWVVVPLSAAIESVSSGRADVAAGDWYITEARGEIVGQTDPVFRDFNAIVSDSGDPSLDAYATMGTLEGFTWVEELRAIYGDGLRLYQSRDAVIADLAAGRIEAGLLSGIDAGYLAEQADAGLQSVVMDPDPRVKSSEGRAFTGIPFQLGRDDIGEALNAAIAEYRDNGFLADILEEWLAQASADVEN